MNVSATFFFCPFRMKIIASYNIKRGVFYEKEKRQRLIKQFVKEYEIEKQERLVELLAKKMY